MKKSISLLVAFQFLAHFNFVFADEPLQDPVEDQVDEQIPDENPQDEPDPESEPNPDENPPEEQQDPELEEEPNPDPEPNEEAEGDDPDPQEEQEDDPDPELEPDPEPEPDSEPEPESEDENEPEEDVEPTIFINEILADPSTDEAENEFIELYNYGDSPIDVTGWQLDDNDLEDNDFYSFQNPDIDYLLDPGAFLTLFRSETDIVLNNDEDSVFLFDDEGEEIDFYVFDSTATERSWGRDPNNDEEWMLFPTPSPGEENYFNNDPPVPVITLQGGTGGLKINVTGAESYDPNDDDLTFLWEFDGDFSSEKENPTTYKFSESGQKTITLTVMDEFGASAKTSHQFSAESDPVDEPQDEEGEEKEQDSEPVEYPKYLLINEVMPDPQGADGESEWVELYNSTTEPIDLSFWYVDDEEGASSAYQIPEGTIVDVGEYLIFENPVLNLSLKNSEDVIRLLNPNQDEVQRVDYSDSQEGWSFALSDDDSFVWTSLATPEAKNEFPPPPKAYQPGDVLFESVLPNPGGADSGKEKILLKNTLSEAVDLSHWKIADKTGEQRLMDLSIAANATKKLTSDDFLLNLNNADEFLYLFDPADNLIDEISWKTSSDDQWLFNSNALSDGMQVVVTEVVDGDTLKISFDDKKLTLRLLGVDTPETVHPSKPVEYFGKEASDYLKNLVEGKQVTLSFDQQKIDSYSRALAYVYIDDLFVNEEILKQGYGYAYTRFPFKYLEAFKAHEAEAKASNRGLWADPDVVEHVEEKINEEDKQVIEEAEISPLITIGDDEEVVEPLDSPATFEAINEDDEKEAVVDLETEKVLNLECDSDALKLHSILPNPEKGVTEEFIKLVNTGDQELCLAGWQLDDEQDAGSKPFTIQEGVVAPGEVVEFGKEITKISLNNSNDCATLIRPNGEKADEICYEKTKKNEIFTHQCGDQASPTGSTSNSGSDSSKAVEASAEEVGPKHEFGRDSSSYRSELVNDVFSGYIIGIDEEEEVLVVRLEDETIRPVSYAHSLFDMDMAKKLLKMSELVSFEAYSTVDSTFLISMNSPGLTNGMKSGYSGFFYILFALPVVGLGLFAYKKFNFKWRGLFSYG